MGCVFDCLETCNTANFSKPDGAIASPFVEVTLGRTITVGNKASPPDNHAFIKSFQYGVSTGQGIEFEVIDQEGGQFSNFMKRFTKNPLDTGPDFEMIFKFGWIVENCDGSHKRISTPEMTLIAVSVKATYEGGIIRFNITGTDHFIRLAQSKTDNNQGSDSAKRPLKQAISKLLKESVPPVNHVSYLRTNAQGEVEPKQWNFNVGGDKGPVATYKANNQNPIDTIRDWIKPLRTDKDKGITIEWDCVGDRVNSNGNHLVLWEEITPQDPDKCIRQYIVNGGNCSNIISFNVDAEWLFSANGFKGTSGVGNNSGGASLNSTLNAPEHPGDKSTGMLSYDPPPENINQIYSPSQAGSQMVKSNIAHQRAAGQRLESKQNVNIQLTVVGDVGLVEPILLRGKFVSIIVVNPFYIGSDGGQCGDWLANPVCNPDFTSKEWMINEISHQIKEGSFVTILKVSCEKCLGPTTTNSTTATAQ